MILIDKTKELVMFEFDGKVYQMTRDEIEAAYRYREFEYRRSDAETQALKGGQHEPKTRKTEAP